MDYQNSIVERLGTDEALAAATAAVSAARERGIPVVFVRVAFRPGAPEAARTNKMFGGMRERIGAQAPGATDVHSAFGVGDDDLVVTKLRVSAFAGSDLEVLLRGLEVRDLVLAGIATSGVVLSTLRQAADLDFGVTSSRTHAPTATRRSTASSPRRSSRGRPRSSPSPSGPPRSEPFRGHGVDTTHDRLREPVRVRHRWVDAAPRLRHLADPRR